MAWKQIKRKVSNWSLNLRIEPDDDLTSMEVYDPVLNNLDEEPTEIHLILPAAPSPRTPRTPKSIQSFSPFTPSPVFSSCNRFSSVDIKRNLAYIPKKSPPPLPIHTTRGGKVKYFLKLPPKPFQDAPDVVRSILLRAGTISGGSKRSLKGRSTSFLKRKKKEEEEEEPKPWMKEVLSGSSYQTASSGEEERTLNVEKPSVQAMAMKPEKKGQLDPGSPSKMVCMKELGPPLPQGGNSNGYSSDESFNFFDESAAPVKAEKGKKEEIVATLELSSKKKENSGAIHKRTFNWGDELTREMVDMLEKHQL